MAVNSGLPFLLHFMINESPWSCLAMAVNSGLPFLLHFMIKQLFFFYYNGLFDKIIPDFWKYVKKKRGKSFVLLFFDAHVICKKKYSFSRVVFLFFQTKIANSLYSKINDSSRVRTTGFSSSRFTWVRVFVVPNIFMIYPKHFSIPEISETLRGSPTKYFGTVRQKNSKENLDTPPSLLSINFFDTRNFVKHSTEKFPYEVFRYCETKKIDRKSWHYPLKHKIFRYPELVTH